jgi:hypothetical protein
VEGNFEKMVLKFMGSRNCLFCIVTILRDGGAGVRFTSELRGSLSSYASIPSMGPHSVGTGALFFKRDLLHRQYTYTECTRINYIIVPVTNLNKY